MKSELGRSELRRMDQIEQQRKKRPVEARWTLSFLVPPKYAKSNFFESGITIKHSIASNNNADNFDRLINSAGKL